MLIQPVAADDVAAALAHIATRAPVNGTVELAGPEPLRLDELVRRVLEADGDAPDARDPHPRVPDTHRVWAGVGRLTNNQQRARIGLRSFVRTRHYATLGATDF